MALYDFQKKALLLSRDRLGKKPLYWAKHGGSVYFASEIKALLQVPALSRSRGVNAAALYQWVVEGRKDLDFSTCFDGIHSLPSASWAIVDESFPQNARQYWSLPGERMSESDISTAEAASTLRGLLDDAVRIRLRADVPLAVELSGGLDSSTLVALAAQQRPGKITTYTVQFPDKDCDEEPYARSVAKYYGTDYGVLASPTANFWSQIQAFTYLEEEPYHSPNLQTNQVIWAQMRAMGTKVSLNGAGGDENFAGYSRYYMPAQTGNLRDGRWGAYLINALTYSQGRSNLRGLILPLLRVAREKFQVSSFQDRSPKASEYFLGSRPLDGPPEPNNLHQALYGDMSNTLMPYWLRSGDRGFMGIPLEVRAPFLDYRVVDFAFCLPTTYLFRNGWHKWILRKAMEDSLPANVIWRRKKLGFPFPFDRFYKENAQILDLIVNESKNPFLDYEQRKRYSRDWKVLSFLLWYELFFHDNLALFKEIAGLASQRNATEDCGYVPQFLASVDQTG